MPEFEALALHTSDGPVPVVHEQLNDRKFGDPDVKRLQLHFAVEALVQVQNGLFADIWFEPLRQDKSRHKQRYSCRYKD
jgi:hypothetical protein